MLHRPQDGGLGSSNPAVGSVEIASHLHDSCNASHVGRDESGSLEGDNSDDEDVHGIVSGAGSRDGIFGQAMYQRSHEGVVVDYDDSGDDAYVCSHCSTFFWSSEALKKKVKNQLTYTHCCEKGKVHIPLSYPTPCFLDELLNPKSGRRSVISGQY